MYLSEAKTACAKKKKHLETDTESPEHPAFGTVRGINSRASDNVEKKVFSVGQVLERNAKEHQLHARM